MQNDLNHRAMLAVLNRRIWQAAATDRNIAEKAEKEAGAERGTLKVIKELVPKDYLSSIRRIADIGYDEHVKMTVPGFMRGQNLLCTGALERYSSIQKEIIYNFQKEVESFIDIYPGLYSKAQKRLGRSFRPNDFPSHNELPGYFEYSIKFFPVPRVMDWRIEGLADGDVEKYRDEAYQSIKAMYDAATLEVFRRAKLTLTSLADQATKYEPKFGGASLLREATIEAIKEMANLVSEMNIAHDPELYKIGKEMRDNFAKLDAKALRHSEEERKTVAVTAMDILKRINARV